MIPYIVWNSIYYLFFVILTNVPALSDYANASKYEFSLIAWLSSLWANEYYTLWFLKNLVIYIFISPVLYIILKDWSRVPSGLIVLLVILNLGTVIQDVLIPDGLCMFMAGSYLAINHCYKAQYSSRLLSVWGLLIIILMFITGCRYLNDTTQVLFFIGIWYALDIFDLRQDNDMPYFMKITFFTYVAHDLILETLEKIWLLIMGVSPIFALLDYLCMPFITLSILVTISKIFKRIVPGLWNILNGYRQ